MTHRLLLILGTLLALFTASAVGAQERGAISGKVADKKTGHAIPFATVSIPTIKMGGLTDSEGQFRIANVPVGSYELQVQFLGYDTAKQTAVVTAGRTATVNFQVSEVVVHQEKAIEVTAERRLVEVKQGATIRSVNAAEIRQMPVQTISDVLQQQAGVQIENDQVHVRGGRADETLFVVNGVTNRDLVTGASTAGSLNARSVAEVNVATGAYDVRYGNALSGVVEVKLREGGDRFTGGMTLANGSYGGRSFQLVAGGPFRQPFLQGRLSQIIDVSGSLYDTRFRSLNTSPTGFFEPIYQPSGFPHLKSSYEDSFFGKSFHYPDWMAPSEDNDWAARYGLSWRPGSADKVTFDASKRIAIDQGFSRTFINASGDAGDPAYPWAWAHRITNAPTIFEDNVQTSIDWRHTLSTTGYTQVQFHRYFFAQRQDVRGKMWPDFEQPDDFSAFLPGDPRREDFFFDSGDDNQWQDRRTTTYGIQASGVQRLFKRHEFELGWDHEFQTVQYLTIQDPWVFDPDGLGDAHDMWLVHPWVGDVYLRDRIEYEGFIGNLGVRADYWFVGREAEQAVADTSNSNMSPTIRTQFYDDTKSFFGRRYKMHISPRVIVAHPITENSSFFFNYGQFTQNPSYRYVYSKLTSISSESFPLLGNPDLNPQVSINYEVGAKHQFLPTAAANLTFFVKDIYDYPSATRFQKTEGVTEPIDIFVYLNGHFARSKGFELEIAKRRSRFWAGRLSYTFQQTKGKSSNATEQKVVEEGGGDASETRLSETFVSWNRPHKVTANLDLRFDDEAPEHWAFLKHTGFNFYLQGQSGRPYTPVVLVGGATEQSAETFSKNAPIQFTLDMKTNHWFRVGGQRLDLSVQGTNLFNSHVISRVDPLTGEGRIWGEGSFDPNVVTSATNYTRVSQVEDPSNYGAGTQWRLTLDYDF